MVDERLKSDLNKIRNEMLIIIYYIIAISFVAKTLFMGADLKNTITEFVILIFVPVYQFIRASRLKISMMDFYPGKRKYARSTAIALIIASIVYLVVLLTGKNYETVPALINLVFFIAAFVAVRMLSLKFYKKQKEKNEKEFDE